MSLDEKIKQLEDSVGDVMNKKSPAEIMRSELSMVQMTISVDKILESIIKSVASATAKIFAVLTVEHEAEMEERTKALTTKLDQMNNAEVKVTNLDEMPMPTKMEVTNLKDLPAPQVHVKPTPVVIPKDLQATIIKQVETYQIPPTSTTIGRNSVGLINTITEEYPEFTIVSTIRRDNNSLPIRIETEVTR